MKDDTIRSQDSVGGLPPEMRRAMWRLILGYWGIMFVIDSLFGQLMNIDPIESAPYKLVGYSAVTAMSVTIAHLLYRSRDKSFLHKAMLALAAAAIATPILAVLDFLTYMACQYPQPVQFDPEYSGIASIIAFCQCLGWATLFTAAIYSFEVRDRERRLAAVREEAMHAQMQALRYQINPHFLFNTLNSIAGLIEEGAATHAEKMVLSLSTFLRTTLTLDPVHDVPLAEEIALQEEYLDIEHTRFSDRMKVRIEVGEDARAALVPSLILQPLIENAVKHGVGSATGPVEISLSAARKADRLHIVVENDLPETASRPQPPGMGVGLRNVADRLRARFQEQGVLSSGITASRRYRASIDLPWRLA